MCGDVPSSKESSIIGCFLRNSEIAAGKIGYAILDEIDPQPEPAREFSDMMEAEALRKSRLELDEAMGADLIEAEEDEAKPAVADVDEEDAPVEEADLGEAADEE